MTTRSTDNAERPIWLNTELIKAAARPRRKIHLDFHNTEHIGSVGEDFDAAEFVRTLQDASVDSVVVFAKDMHGYFYYPSELGPVHPGLAGRDLLGEQIAACKAAGIKVFAYYCTGWDNYLAERHPEWLSFNRERQTYLPKFDEPPFWTAMCMSNDDFVELMLDHSREILSRYRPDGIWYDMPFPNIDGECFCSNCLAAIKADGKDPLDVDVQRERMQVLLTRWLQVSKEACEAVLPGCIVEQNNQTRFGLAERAPYLSNVDIEALPTGGWGYGYFPVMARFARGLGLPYCGMTGRFHRSWADFGGLKSDTQLRLEVAAIAATGADVSIGDQPPPNGRLDARVYRAIGAAYGDLRAIDHVLEGAVGVAEAAVYVKGLQLADFAMEERHGSITLRDGVRGVSQLLIEAGIQFDVVEAGTVDLARYRLVVIPDGVELDDAAVAELEAFRVGGGALVHLTGPGDPVQNFPWIRALGVTSAEASPYTPAYVRLTGEVGSSHDDFDFALYDGASRWTAVPGAGVTVAATLGEPLFQRSAREYTSHAQTPVHTQTKDPVVLIGPNVAAIAFPLGAGYHRHGYWIYSEILQTVLRRVYPHPVVRVDAPKTLETSVTYQPAGDGHGERWIIHLVNFAGASRPAPGRIEYYDNEWPINDVELSVALPISATKATALKGQVQLPVEYRDGRAHLTVPAIGLHEAVVIEDVTEPEPSRS